VVTLGQTKNGDKLAQVPLSSRAVKAFRQLPRGIADAPVVPIHHDVLSHRFVECCRAAGITGLRLHDLRAECVSRLFEKGLTLPEVRAISRHNSTALLRYVRHADVEGLRAKLG
jgi:integrase